MDSDDDEREPVDHRVFSKVLSMFDGNPDFQQILRLGLQAELAGKEDVYMIPQCSELPIDPEECFKASNWTSDGRYIGNFTKPANAVPVPSYLHAYANPHRSDVLNNLAKETRQKEKKRLEEIQKENPNSRKNEDEGDDAQACKPEKSTADNSDSSIRQQLCAKDTGSSDCSGEEFSDEDRDTEEETGDFEELDMTSTFVSKAADIARRKLELKPKPDKREKKKSPAKEEPKSSADKTYEKPVTENKDTVASSSLSFEENVKISTDLANTGNRFASNGDFHTAVKYFTDAIKFNPTEFKLFGNRSFCFEKMQEYEKALADAELSLSMHPGWVKGLFRKGRALAGLKRYDEATQAFREVLKQDGSCAEAAQELMRVQITQLVGYGYSREQSSNALIIHGTVEKAREVLSKLEGQPGPVLKSALPPPQVVNVSGVSPVLSATNFAPPLPQNAPKPPNKPLVPVQNMPNVHVQPKPVPHPAPRTNSVDQHLPQELFPVWVGNLFQPVSESDINHLFNKVGEVHSVKLLSYKRCAFVNFTKQEYCDEAIRRLHGFDLNGVKIAVRYPDRIPQGMGISRSALKAEDLQDENARHMYGYGRNAVGGRRPFHPHDHVYDYRGNYKY